MKSTFTILVFLLFNCYVLLAQQNLVPNGSFEEYSSCPLQNNVFNGEFEKANGWFNPTLGTPDFFHRCNNTSGQANEGMVGVPDNFWGHQEAYDGDGYVGFVPYEWHYQDYNIIGSEYLGVELLQPLKPCHSYKFSMRVNLANNSTYANSKLGVYVSHEQIETFTADLLQREAQIVNTVLLEDTVNWLEISGELQAKGNEQYLYIGYFDDPFVNDTSFIQGPPFGGEWWSGYYYVDSVSLIELDEIEDCAIQLANVFTPNNDGTNDSFHLDILAHEKAFEFTILNRWGNVITILTKDNSIWDGTTNSGKPCTPGVYFYTYTVEKWDGTQVNGNGTIHLMR